MNCVWVSRTVPDREAPVVAMGVELMNSRSPFLTAFREAAREAGCTLVLLCAERTRIKPPFAEAKGFHYIVNYDSVGSCTRHDIVARLARRGTAIVGRFSASTMLWCVKKGVFFNPDEVTIEMLDESRSGAFRLFERVRAIEVLEVVRTFPSGGPVTKPRPLEDALPPEVAPSVCAKLTAIGYSL